MARRWRREWDGAGRPGPRPADSLRSRPPGHPALRVEPGGFSPTPGWLRCGLYMAEGVGFEPTGHFRGRRFSRPVQSTALPSLRYCKYAAGFARLIHEPRPPLRYGLRAARCAVLALDCSRQSSQDRCNQPLCHPSGTASMPPVLLGSSMSLALRCATGCARRVEPCSRSIAPGNRVKTGARPLCHPSGAASMPPVLLGSSRRARCCRLGLRRVAKYP